MILTTAVIKGGTGKTSTAAALAQCAVANKRKVLAVDLDPQANLSAILGGNDRTEGASRLFSGKDPRELIQRTEQGIDLICGDLELSQLPAKGNGAKLKAALDSVRSDYDLILIDTPPTIGPLPTIAMLASDGLIAPLDADMSSLQGLKHITDLAESVRKTRPEALSFIGALVTKFDGRPKLNQVMLGMIQAEAKRRGVAFLGTVRSGIAAKESQVLKRSLFEYAPKSKPAEDYKRIFGYLMNQ